jgi:hypothetical protein
MSTPIEDAPVPRDEVDGFLRAARTQGMMDGTVATIALMSKMPAQIAEIARSLPLSDAEKLELQTDMSEARSREDKIKLVIRYVAENDCFNSLLSAFGKSQNQGRDGFSL